MNNTDEFKDKQIDDIHWDGEVIYSKEANYEEYVRLAEERQLKRTDKK